MSVKDRNKKNLLSILAAIFLLIIGSSLTMLYLSWRFRHTFYGLSTEHWTIFATLALIGFFLINIFRVKIQKEENGLINEMEKQEKEKTENDSINLRADFEKFKRECLHVYKGYLKISTLFWIHYTQKEKVQSFEDTKKTVFKDLKKEFSDVSWMKEVIDMVKEEISKYEKQSKKEAPAKPAPESDA